MYFKFNDFILEKMDSDSSRHYTVIFWKKVTACMRNFTKIFYIYMYIHVSLCLCAIRFTLLWYVQLVDIKWKLGVAVCSDECKSLNSPFVTMILKVADASGKISTHTFELTIPQFQVNHVELNEIYKKESSLFYWYLFVKKFSVFRM